MVTGKRFQITYIEVGTTDTKKVTMEVTAEQLTQTVRRRINTLLPNARITDITEETPDSVQLDALNKKVK